MLKQWLLADGKVDSIVVEKKYVRYVEVGAFERHAPSVDSMHEAAEEKVGQPLSEVVVEEVNDFLDVHKPTLATIEGDVRDAKKRIALAKPRSRPAPKVEPEPASSDEGSASGGDK